MNPKRFLEAEEGTLVCTGLGTGGQEDLEEPAAVVEEWGEPGNKVRDEIRGFPTATKEEEGQPQEISVRDGGPVAGEVPKLGRRDAERLDPEKEELIRVLRDIPEGRVVVDDDTEEAGITTVFQRHFWMRMALGWMWDGAASHLVAWRQEAAEEIDDAREESALIAGDEHDRGAGLLQHCAQQHEEWPQEDQPMSEFDRVDFSDVVKELKVGVRQQRTCLQTAGENLQLGR